MLRQVQVRLEHKHTLRRVRGLGVVGDIPNARRAILREPDVALARGGLMEGFRSGVRAEQRRQLGRVDVFLLEQLEQRIATGVHVRELVGRSWVGGVGTTDKCIHLRKGLIGLAGAWRSQSWGGGGAGGNIQQGQAGK